MPHTSVVLSQKEKQKQAEETVRREEDRKKKNYENRQYRLRVIKNRPWILILQQMRSRCSCSSHGSYRWYGAKGIKCFINTDQIKELWIRDRAYKMIKPSIDRINPYGNYEFTNCRFIESKENSSRAARRPIYQVIDNKRTKLFISVREADKYMSRIFGINIKRRIKDYFYGRTEKAYGCKWEYA